MVPQAITLAPVSKPVQVRFMKHLAAAHRHSPKACKLEVLLRVRLLLRPRVTFCIQTSTSGVEIEFHGTQLGSHKNVFRYGLLVGGRNRRGVGKQCLGATPRNRLDASALVGVRHGRVYGRGVYSSPVEFIARCYADSESLLVVGRCPCATTSGAIRCARPPQSRSCDRALTRSLCVV